MKREIKFRAFDKKYKVMRYGGDLLSTGLLHFKFYYPEEQGIKIGNYIRNLVDPTQYTGFQDIDDNGIYEGDIVRAEQTGVYQGIIEWWKDRWALAYKGFTDGTKNYQSLSTVLGAKIIGNKFEDPKLFKDLCLK